MAPTLGYWDIRGRAETIRLLLAYAGTEYKDKRYSDRNVWLNDKSNLGLDFPNLPYYLDGEVKLTQSMAIMRHIARKNKLEGQTEKEKARVDVAEQQLIDINSALSDLAYNPNFELVKSEYLKNLDTSLQLLSKFLGTRPFLAGESVTYVDFIGYEYLDRIRMLSPESLAKVANLKKYTERVETLPPVAKYLKTAPKRDEIYAPFAKWMPMKVGK